MEDEAEVRKPEARNWKLESDWSLMNPGTLGQFPDFLEHEFLLPEGILNLDQRVF